MPGRSESQSRRALVVFGGNPELAWLRILKRGYRHCFVVLEAGPVDRQGGRAKRSNWIVYNPLSHYTEITLVAGLQFATIAGHYRDAGCRVVETQQCQPPHKPVPWRPYTCVEAVKRVLGLHARWVFTPWQLSEILKKTLNEKIILDNRK